jgi:hypothetical protein
MGGREREIDLQALIDQRNDAFWSQNLTDLEKALAGKTIHHQGAEVTIIRAQLYPIDTNDGAVYRPIMLEQHPGVLHGLKYPRNGFAIPLISARENGEGGACILIRQAQVGEAKVSTLSGILRALKIQPEQKFSLKFHDLTSDVLYTGDAPLSIAPESGPTDGGLSGPAQDAKKFFDNLSS